MKQTAVEYLEYMFILQNAIYKNDIDKALEMEKEQMCNFAEFVAKHPDENININKEILRLNLSMMVLKEQ